MQKHTPFILLSAICIVLSTPSLADKSHQKHGKYGMPGNPNKVTRTIKLDATEIAFNTDTIQVRKGETIRFVLANKGVQNHEFTIGDAASHRRNADQDYAYKH